MFSEPSRALRGIAIMLCQTRRIHTTETNNAGTKANGWLPPNQVQSNEGNLKSPARAGSTNPSTGAGLKILNARTTGMNRINGGDLVDIQRLLGNPLRK